MMELVSFFAPTLNSLVELSVKKGIDYASKSIEFSNFQLLLRERLRREMKYNLDLLSETRLSSVVKISGLDLRTVDFIFSQPWPLRKIFPKNITEELNSVMATGDNRHQIWSRDIESECDLIERIWLRISIARKRADSRVSTGDLAYLKKLLLVLKTSLK